MDSIFKIKNFQDFIFESNASKIEKFYLLINYTREDTDNKIALYNRKCMDSMFERVTINIDNYEKLKFDKNIPILSFTTDDNLLIELMIEKNIIKKTSLYNLPEYRSISADKVLFHKKFNHSKYIPKTVFTKEEAKKLKFPIIAKPARGHSAIGIKKFSKVEDFMKDDSVFDVFSEMFNIKKEFRCFCFKDEILSLNERIKQKGSKDFLKNADTKTDFFYNNIDVKSFLYLKDLTAIINECRKLVPLDFFAVDFAVDEKEQIYLIEINAKSGMGVEKSTKLYRLMYKDFYGKDVDKNTDEILNKMVLKYQDMYDNTSNIDECTTLAGNLNNINFLFKNRDRSFTPDTIIKNEKINGVEVAYYTDQTGWTEGMNEFGIGFVFSQLTNKEYQTYKPSQKISDEPKSTTEFKPFQEKIKKLLSSKTIEEMVEKIKASKKGGSFLIGDSKKFIELEGKKGTYKQRKIEFDEVPYYAKTNHGELIQSAGHQYSGYGIKRASSDIRKHQAYSQLLGVQDISEIPAKMKFQMFEPNSSLNTFRTDDEEYTISQCMMDLTNVKFYFYHDFNTADSIKIESDIKDPKIKIELIKCK